MEKKYFWLSFLLMTLLSFSACSSDDEEEIEAPLAAILNPEHLDAIHTDSTLYLKARLLNKTTAEYIWYVNGEEVSKDSVFHFLSREKGEFAITLKAYNIQGESTAELQIKVIDGFYLSDIKNWTGEGENESALVLQWVTAEDITNPEDDEVFALVWGYRWKTADRPSGITMLKEIVRHNPRLYIIISNQWGGTTLKGFGYDGNNDGKIELQNETLHLTETDFGDDHIYVAEENSEDVDGLILTDPADYWMGGWYETYSSYWIGEGDAVLTPEGYSYSNTVPDLRILNDKSWDVWTYSTINASASNVYPIPRLFKAAPKN